MSTDDVEPPFSGVDAPSPTAPSPPAPGTAVQKGGESAASLASAVDELDRLSDLPVHTHAERYHEVHTLLQDALSDTDR